MAQHLSSQGLAVDRLPLVRVPTELLVHHELFAHPEFLLTWNNVVIERDGDGRMVAEGFASLLPSADRRAREVFAGSGMRLELLPPLVESVRRNGGYRCSSKHLRSPG